MRMIITSLLALAVIAVFVIGFDWTGVTQWVVEQQRAFQNQMAGAVRALKAGDAGAYIALLTATGAYGFVHALGPGHGKYLMGGLGLGTSVSASQLVGIASAASIAQALWAIVLGYGGFSLISITAQQVTFLAEDVLAPASYLAIACVGLLLIWRGARRISQARKSRVPQTHRSHAHANTHVYDHDHETCGCGGHHVSAQEIAKLRSFREALALIGSVAIRPCTGAIFLLVIAWQMDILLAGAVAVIVMGLGTAALTSLVALSSVTARKLALVTNSPTGVQATVFSASQVFVGISMTWLSLGLLWVAL